MNNKIIEKKKKKKKCEIQLTLVRSKPCSSTVLPQFLARARGVKLRVGEAQKIQNVQKSVPNGGKMYIYDVDPFYISSKTSNRNITNFL